MWSLKLFKKKFSYKPDSVCAFLKKLKNEQGYHLSTMCVAAHLYLPTPHAARVALFTIFEKQK